MSGPTFRKVSQFATDGADQQRQLSQLEGDVADAIADIAVRGAIKLRSTSLKKANYEAQLNDCVRCSGTFSVLLPTANKANDGRAVGVLVETAGTITVLSATSQVQGGATDALATKGLRIYQSNGQDWWRAP